MNKSSFTLAQFHTHLSNRHPLSVIERREADGVLVYLRAIGAVEPTGETVPTLVDGKPRGKGSILYRVVDSKCPLPLLAHFFEE